jgi:hypothetical protein
LDQGTFLLELTTNDKQLTTQNEPPMPDRKAFLLRIDPAVLEAIQRWADDDLRSLNGQIEFILRKALAQSGRQRPKGEAPVSQPSQEPQS